MTVQELINDLSEIENKNKDIQILDSGYIKDCSVCIDSIDESESWVTIRVS